MIVYQSTKAGFANDILSNDIEGIIFRAFTDSFGHGTSKSEINSWKNSMACMNVVLADNEIPDNVGITIEYRIPQTSKRVDFIITGLDEYQKNNAVLIELKQWSEATPTTKDGIVVTYVGHMEREVSHPSYQAWSYAALLEGFNEAVYQNNVGIQPCAYLHNYVRDDVITNDFYAPYLDKAPVFLKDDAHKLRDFIKKFVKYGDRGSTMYQIENSKIRPSKNLADSLASLLSGNQEFVMIDDQKLVYETVLSFSRSSTASNKNVIIVEGGPGTGKSVVAVNLLVALTNLRMNSQYVTKNAAPRAVYESKLTGTFRKSQFTNLFSGSGSFTDCEENTFDTLIVDEAHRLNAKSGMFQNLGENQIQEIIYSSRCSVFFIDEDQKVTLRDIGEKEEIIYWAHKLGAKVHRFELSSQFRCNGADGYLSWLDNVLQIRETANTYLDQVGYDFRIIDSPTELRDIIFEKNQERNKARLVAGYCWDWKSKNSLDKSLNDVVIPEYNFGMRWNLASDGNLWIMAPKSVSEVGCIHTCQGLEMDYVGVIIGPDLIINDGRIVTDSTKRAKTDKSLQGLKVMMRTDPEKAKRTADSIIKNTYRTLMTRGTKGCFVYCTDKDLADYFKSRIILSK